MRLNYAIIKCARWSLVAIFCGTPTLARTAVELHPNVGQRISDESWLKGKFSGSTPIERSTYSEKLNEARNCQVARTDTVKADLKNLGFKADNIVKSGYGKVDCDIAINLDRLSKDFSSWPEFQANLQMAQLLVAGITAGLEVQRLGSSAEQLFDLSAAEIRRSPDQALRRWASDDFELFKSILDPKAVPLFNSLILSQLARIDASNSDTLKQYLEQKGWGNLRRLALKPTSEAWLIIQHADSDPALQVKALNLLRPLARENKLFGPKYALLYDRVHFSLIGKQYYGTQLSCVSGKLIPEGLELPANVDSRRAASGLEPLAIYESSVLRELGGKC